MKLNSRSAPKAKAENAKEDFFLKQARKNINFYSRLCDRNYKPSRFHLWLGQIMQEIAAKRKRRVIISVPPQHGKSRHVVTEFASYYLGCNPSHVIGLASYGQKLSNKGSRSVRARCRSAAFQRIFPEVELSKSQSAVNDWATVQGGGMKATGIGGPLTGEMLNILLIDDPIKNFEEASSPTIREKVWDWFWSTAYTRLREDAPIVIIMTRWHTDDPVGRLTSADRKARLEALGVDDEQWEVINLPAIAEDNDPMGREPGEALWPERFSERRLRNMAAVQLPHIWSAMYDGNPVPKGGNYMDPNNFVVISPDMLPVNLRWVRYWDLAASEKKTADYTAGVMFSADPLGNIYIRDMLFGIWDWPKAKLKITSTAEDELVEVGIEAVAGFKVAYSELWQALSEKVVIREFGADKDKLTRALPWIAKVQNKKVFLVAGDWITTFKSQCEAFPKGAHDDLIDAVSGAWMMFFGPAQSGESEVVDSVDGRPDDGPTLSRENRRAGRTLW